MELYVTFVNGETKRFDIQEDNSDKVKKAIKESGTSIEITKDKATEIIYTDHIAYVKIVED